MPESLLSSIHPQMDELIALRFAARGLTLAPKRPASATTAGIYRSRFRGRGVDYIESRSYQAGDDIRNMDWRVTARTGKAHTKVFQEERERPVIVLLDCGASMFFGTQQVLKSIQAARLAACIGWAAVHHGDRIGAFAYSKDMHQEMRPIGGRRGALRMVRHLQDWLAPPNTADALSMHSIEANSEALAQALKRLRHVARPGSLVVMISDFYHLNTDTKRHLSLLRNHNDIVACQIYDPIEKMPPPPGAYPISNGQQRGVLNTKGQSAQTHYVEKMQAHFEQTKQVTRQLGIPLEQAATNDSPLSVIQRLFRT